MEAQEERKTCQVCARQIKASNGVIAHHGYRRPYEGWQTSSCLGAKYVPYEVSCERLREVAKQVQSYLDKQVAAQLAFLTDPPEILSVSEKVFTWGREEQREYIKPEHFNLVNYRSSIPYTYEYLYAERKYAYKSIIASVTVDLAMMLTRVQAWKPVEESKEEKG